MIPTESVQPTASQVPTTIPTESVQPTASQVPTTIPTESVQPTASQVPTMSQVPTTIPTESVQPTDCYDLYGITESDIIEQTGSDKPLPIDAIKIIEGQNSNVTIGKLRSKPLPLRKTLKTLTSLL
jgi:hypothetical protein